MIDQVDNQLEKRLDFLEHIVFVWGEYSLSGNTSPQILDFLDILEGEGLIEKVSDSSYKPTKAGTTKAIERRDRNLQNAFPVYKADPIGGTVELVSTIDPFESACDQTRYLMWDWMEYLDKHNVAIEHDQYLRMWGETFNRVWAKIRNTGVMSNDW